MALFQHDLPKRDISACAVAACIADRHSRCARIL